jgi:hypothetical protein
MIAPKSWKIAALCGALLLGGTSSAEAVWPFCNLFGGYGSPSTGYGTYTSFYGPTGSYGYNPFAPLVPDPRCGGCQPMMGFGMNPYGSAPCGGGGCATGNCSLATTNQPLRPTPDTPPRTNDPPSTYDREEAPMDDPNFERGVPDDDPGFPGLGVESFKIPMNVDETNGSTLPKDKTPPAELKEEDDENQNSETEESATPAAPRPQSLSAPHLIDPRNSAALESFRSLEHQITWRAEPVLVRSRPAVQTSRPLVVRRAVRTGGTEREPSLLTRSTAE